MHYNVKKVNVTYAFEIDADSHRATSAWLSLDPFVMGKQINHDKNPSAGSSGQIPTPTDLRSTAPAGSAVAYHGECAALDDHCPHGWIRRGRTSNIKSSTATMQDSRATTPH
jgi:hypothetical protein